MYICILDFLFYSEPAPPPETLLMHLTNGAKELTFSWSQVPFTCPTLYYNITSINCGSCNQSTTLNSVTCTSFTPSISNTLCTFSVQTVICGNLAGEMRILDVNLKGVSSGITITLTITCTSTILMQFQMSQFTKVFLDTYLDV